jgi:glycosyltransferase involved in cell wall biosynthesis
MERTDVLVAPSICFETFGFTVLEALSFGVPVIVSDCVGAKEIIPVGGGLVFDHTSVRDLISIIGSLNAETLKTMNRNIVNATPAKTIERFSDELKTLVYSV